ncbi:MAG: hypothetical protein ACTSV3_00520 [Candidatus Thorarchaeota archaeon]
MSEGLRPGFFTADMIVRKKIGTGNRSLDSLLGGGFENGLMHLFYGDRCLNDDLMRFAVRSQMPAAEGGSGAPVIIIDNANMIKIETLTDIASELGLDPEETMRHIYVSRAFNASQTYDLVVDQIESFFRRIPARTLIVSGLPDLFIREGLTNEGLRQLSHMAAKLKNFTLQRDLITLTSAPLADSKRNLPAGGKTLASSAQVHVKVEERTSYVMYTLAKHPQHPVRSVMWTHAVPTDGTIPLSHFLGGEGEEE